MSLWKIAWKSISQRALASALTGLSMALGVTLVVAVLVVSKKVEESFSNPALGYDMIVGARGGDYQLVLNTVYHLSQPVENLPWAYYKKFVKDPYSPYELAELFQSLPKLDPHPEATPRETAAALPDEQQPIAKSRREVLLSRLLDAYTQTLQEPDRKKLASLLDANANDSLGPVLAACDLAKLKQLAAASDLLRLPLELRHSPLGSNVTPLKELARRGLSHRDATADVATVVQQAIDMREYSDRVARVIPYCLGDNYEGFRVVGTVPAIFDPNFEFAPGRRYHFTAGENFKPDGYHQAVVGSAVARATGVQVGDEIQPTHGVTNEGEDAHKHDAFQVVGVLAPSGTPNDRAVFINMEGFLLIPDHAKPVEEEEGAEKAPPVQVEGLPPPLPAGHETALRPLPENQREITSMLVRTADASGLQGMVMAQQINEAARAQATNPVRVISKLMGTFVGPIQYVLLGLTVMIVIVSGISILVSIYNSMSERQKDIAVMRALGARRRTVLSIVLIESVMLSLGGGVVGWLLGHVLTWSASGWLSEKAGVTVSFWEPIWLVQSVQLDARYDIMVPLEVVLIVGLVVLASLVGIAPALKAYGTDVAQRLSASP